MSNPSAPKHTVSFDIKSTMLSLESFIIRSPNLSQVLSDLESRFSKHPDFFDNDPVLIDLTQLESLEGSSNVDLSQLYQALKQFKMNPVALRSNVPSHQAWAELSGLFLVNQAQLGHQKKISPAPSENAQAVVSTPSSAVDARTHPPSELSPPVSDAVSSPEPSRTGASSASRAQSESSAHAESQGLTQAAPSCALIVDKPLRSGQHVYAKGRDLIVMAMVNPGAEIMADGHIHVYAPLRGKAIAGARGNQDARIYTTCLEAELLSIAGIYRTSDTPIPKEVAGKAAQIRLIDEKLVMQPN
jgi:septum site-determining protein MinC